MKEKLNAFIEKFKKEALLDVIKIELLPNPTVGITQSKVGGRFYLPKSACIPTNDKGEQLMFLAQINCEELPENAIYPKKGIVQFWIFGGDYNMGNDYENPCSDINKRVLYYPTIEDHFSEQELAAIYKPKGDEDGDLCTPIMTDTPLSMVFKSEKQWPLLFDYRAGAVFVKKWNSHFPEQQVGSLCEINDIDEDLFGELYDALEIDKHTQIGGYGYFTQSDPRTCESLQNYTELLFQLDSYYGDEDYQILWGDSGVGNFFATKEQLKHLDFAKCLYSWDCC